MADIRDGISDVSGTIGLEGALGAVTTVELRDCCRWRWICASAVVTEDVGGRMGDLTSGGFGNDDGTEGGLTTAFGIIDGVAGASTGVTLLTS